MTTAKTSSFIVGIPLFQTLSPAQSTQLKQLTSMLVELDFQMRFWSEQKNHFLAELAQSAPTQITVEEGSLEHFWKRTSVALFLYNPAPEALKSAWQKGVVPIVPSGAPVLDFNPEREEGNGFIFPRKNQYHYLAAILRSYENHRFAYDWKNLQKNGYKASESVLA